MEDNRTFIYNNLHYIPYRKFKGKKDFQRISWQMADNYENKVGNIYNNTYSHESFYKAANNAKEDIFYCIELDGYFVPCYRTLFYVPKQLAEYFINK